MKDLTEYLTGVIDDSANIDESSRTKKRRVNAQISMEVASRDRNQLLISPGVDYSYALKTYEEAHSKANGDQDSSFLGHTATLIKKQDHRLPIIIVPNISTALMSMFNVKQVSYM